MRDLTVDATHTYYVLAGRTAVLVHNCGEASDELLDIADANVGRTNVAAEAVATDGTRGFGVSMPRTAEGLTPKVEFLADSPERARSVADLLAGELTSTWSLDRGRTVPLLQD